MPVQFSLQKENANLSFVRYWGSKDLDVIKNLIEKNSRENDKVLDPFGGKGTTALASLGLRRKTIYNDLNPFAHVIARASLLPVRIELLTAACNQVLEDVRKKSIVSEMYRTRCTCGSPVEIDRVVWSAVYEKIKVNLSVLNGKEPAQLNRLAALIYRRAGFDEFTHRELLNRIEADARLNAVRKNVITLALNQVLLRRGILTRLRDEPQEIFYSTRCSCGRNSRPASFSDLRHFRKQDFRTVRTAWANGQLRYSNGNLFLKRRNVDSLGELFTKRNLAALSILRSEVENAQIPRDLKNVFRLILASILFAASKMQRSKSGSWPVPCYWVPPTYVEQNVFKLFETRYRRVASFKSKQLRRQRQSVDTKDPQIVFLRSDASRMKLRSNSVDYVIADPPQTDEIQYFELSYLAAAFLGLTLPFQNELVVNSKQGKTEAEYWNKVKLSMNEFVRIVKRGGRLTILLHGEDRAYFSRFDEIVSSLPVQIISSNFKSYTFKNHFHRADKARLNGDYYLTMVKRVPLVHAS